jgi:hypothetical protein
METGVKIKIATRMFKRRQRWPQRLDRCRRDARSGIQTKNNAGPA